MRHLCKASDERLAHDAERVAERLKAGEVVYQCESCCRLSNKRERLCRPRTVSVVHRVVEGPKPVVSEEDI